MVFGRSGGVRGHGMDHTRRFPRTLAGFGLTWHGGSRFSCFLEILETHFITKYRQIGPRASRLVLGFFRKPGHHLRSYKTDWFSKKWPQQQKRNPGNLTTSQKGVTVPAVPKDAWPHPTLQPKNLKTSFRNMFGGFGEFGVTRKKQTSRCLWSLNYLSTRKARKTTKFIFYSISVFFQCLPYCPGGTKIGFRVSGTKKKNRWRVRNVKNSKMVVVVFLAFLVAK